MTGHTHNLAEWAEMVSLAVAVYGTGSVFYFLTVDADPAQRAVYARHDVDRAIASALHTARFEALLVRLAARAAADDARRTAALLVLHVAQARDRVLLAAARSLLALLLRHHAPKGIR